MKDSEEENNTPNETEYIEIRKKVLELGKVKNLRILDIGAGPLSAIAAKYYNCSVTSIDIDRKELHLWEECAEKDCVSDKISFEEEDASDLYYCNDAFDVGICFCALHHFPLKIRDKAVSELSRVSSSHFVIAEYTPEGFLEIHTREEFEPVDLNYLEMALKNIGNLRVIPMENMMVYIVWKNAD
ncbi:MAG: class I SAM-dependent methyltransferase [Methanogenium sp.]|nr:class I SAM-dependent methyltransferase [Methanogenium sp.]